MIKCRAILKDGKIVMGNLIYISKGILSDNGDTSFDIFTANPSPNEVSHILISQCKKITIKNVKDVHANDQDNDDGQ